MIIGIDLRPLQDGSRYRGIGRVVNRMIEHIIPLLDKTEKLVFYVDSGMQRPEILDKYPYVKTKKIPGKRLGKIKYVRAIVSTHNTITPSSDDIDILLQFDASYGVSNSVPCVIVFHDLIPYLFNYKDRSNSKPGLLHIKKVMADKLYWRKYIKSLQKYREAKKIIAISRSSRRDLLRFDTSISSAKVVVAHLGVDQKKYILIKKRIITDDYLLYVGGIDPRKNIVGLLKTFMKIKRKNDRLKIVFVGKEFYMKHSLNALGWDNVLKKYPKFRDSVIIKGYVDDDELFNLYKYCSTFVFPSRYEGFGLPILEAMQAGCPVVAYNNSSIKEIGGDALLLSRNDVEFKRNIEEILKNKKLRNNISNKGKKHVKKFSWDKTAKTFLSVLREVYDQNKDNT